ncbi:MAG: dienelactone hydrolase family protein [Acidobacteria bacterium]|nr:dienelactone hydrolase family protein [Acidobacteriota bacterium]
MRNDFLVLLTGLLLGSLTVAVPAKVPVKEKPGIYTLLLERVEGPSLPVTLSVPEGYSPDRPAPLVVALHYRGPVTPFFGGGMLRELVEPGLRSLNAVMVAPDCPTDRWNDPVSEAAVLELITDVRAAYAVDSEKIILTGYSLGGIGTWYLAARHPGLFCAAIPMASGTNAATVQQIRDIPLYVIHSTADKLLTIHKIRGFVEELRRRGVSVEFREVPGVDHFDVTAFVEPLRDAGGWLRRRWEREE